MALKDSSVRGSNVSQEKGLNILVRSLREQLGMTQERFAAKLGVTFTSVNRWENGHAKPSPLAMKQIEELLRNMGTDGADLLSEFFPDLESKEVE